MIEQEQPFYEELFIAKDFEIDKDNGNNQGAIHIANQFNAKRIFDKSLKSFVLSMNDNAQLKQAKLQLDLEKRQDLYQNQMANSNTVLPQLILVIQALFVKTYIDIIVETISGNQSKQMHIKVTPNCVQLKVSKEAIVLPNHQIVKGKWINLVFNINSFLSNKELTQANSIKIKSVCISSHCKIRSIVFIQTDNSINNLTQNNNNTSYNNEHQVIFAKNNKTNIIEEIIAKIPHLQVQGQQQQQQLPQQQQQLQARGQILTYFLDFQRTEVICDENEIIDTVEGNENSHEEYDENHNQQQQQQQQQAKQQQQQQFDQTEIISTGGDVEHELSTFNNNIKQSLNYNNNNATTSRVIGTASSNSQLGLSVLHNGIIKASSTHFEIQGLGGVTGGGQPNNNSNKFYRNLETAGNSINYSTKEYKQKNVYIQQIQQKIKVRQESPPILRNAFDQQQQQSSIISQNQQNSFQNETTQNNESRIAGTSNNNAIGHKKKSVRCIFYCRSSTVDHNTNNNNNISNIQKSSSRSRESSNNTKFIQQNNVQLPEVEKNSGLADYQNREYYSRVRTSQNYNNNKQSYGLNTSKNNNSATINNGNTRSVQIGSIKSMSPMNRNLQKLQQNPLQNQQLSQQFQTTFLPNNNNAGKNNFTVNTSNNNSPFLIGCTDQSLQQQQIDNNQQGIINKKSFVNCINSGNGGGQSRGLTAASLSTNHSNAQQQQQQTNYSNNLYQQQYQQKGSVNNSNDSSIVGYRKIKINGNSKSPYLNQVLVVPFSMKEKENNQSLSYIQLSKKQQQQLMLQQQKRKGQKRKSNCAISSTQAQSTNTATTNNNNNCVNSLDNQDSLVSPRNLHSSRKTQLLISEENRRRKNTVGEQQIQQQKQENKEEESDTVVNDNSLQQPQKPLKKFLTVRQQKSQIGQQPKPLLLKQNINAFLLQYQQQQQQQSKEQSEKEQFQLQLQKEQQQQQQQLNNENQKNVQSIIEDKSIDFELQQQQEYINKISKFSSSFNDPRICCSPWHLSSNLFTVAQPGQTQSLQQQINQPQQLQQQQQSLQSQQNHNTMMATNCSSQQMTSISQQNQGTAGAATIQNSLFAEKQAFLVFPHHHQGLLRGAAAEDGTGSNSVIISYKPVNYQSTVDATLNNNATIKSTGTVMTAAGVIGVDLEKANKVEEEIEEKIEIENNKSMSMHERSRSFSQQFQESGSKRKQTNNIKNSKIHKKNEGKQTENQSHILSQGQNNNNNNDNKLKKSVSSDETLAVSLVVEDVNLQQKGLNSREEEARKEAERELAQIKAEGLLAFSQRQAVSPFFVNQKLMTTDSEVVQMRRVQDKSITSMIKGEDEEVEEEGLNKVQEDSNSINNNEGSSSGCLKEHKDGREGESENKQQLFNKKKGGDRRNSNNGLDKKIKKAKRELIGNCKNQQQQCQSQVAMK